MNDNDIAHSGSRWEPQAHAVGANTLDWIPADASPADASPAAAGTPRSPVSAGSRAVGGLAGNRGGHRLRGGLLAGAGVGLFLIGGLGGFAVGHAAGADGGSTPTGAVQGRFPGPQPYVGGWHRGPRGDDGASGSGSGPQSPGDQPPISDGAA